MQNRQLPDLQIHTLKTATELENFFRLNAEVFRPGENTDLVRSNRQRFLTLDPDFHRYQLRGAFLGESYVGAYAILERTLCVGPARLRVACINGVVTHPAYRHRGIASSLMYDAIRLAESQHYAFLLLHGVGNFYGQFGYVDLLEDLPQQFIARDQLPTDVPGTYTVRIATLHDAPALLACYQRHYGSYPGSFAPTRTLQRQQHLLMHGSEAQAPQVLITLSPEQELHGYLALVWNRQKLLAYEVATETWGATLALLHAHQQLLEAEPNAPQELDWPVPPDSETFYLLAQHLPVRSETYAFPNGGWMGRAAHMPTLLQSCLPFWQECWQNRPRLVEWQGTFALTLDSHTSVFQVTSGSIDQIEGPASSSAPHATFSSATFLQLLFGFRSLSWILRQPGQQVAAEMLPLLSLLFPGNQAWIAGSDYF